jgi:hypothetical protein
VNKDLNIILAILLYPFTIVEAVAMLLVAGVHWCWVKVYFSALWFPESKRRPVRLNRNQPINTDMAIACMKQVETVANETGTPIYWLSGTLLGLERLGRPLPHDYDLDVGIFAGDSRNDRLMAALAEAGLLAACHSQILGLKCRIQNPDLNGVTNGLLRYKTAVCPEPGDTKNAIKVDFFIHFPYAGGSMHASRNSIWWNSNFNTRQKNYGCGTYTVPLDVERHLTENYGDYKTERKDFENSIDCPNAMDIYSWHSLVYLLTRQYWMVRLARPARAGQVARRIRCTILKGLLPFRNYPPASATAVSPALSIVDETNGVRSR